MPVRHVEETRNGRHNCEIGCYVNSRKLWSQRTEAWSEVRRGLGSGPGRAAVAPKGRSPSQPAFLLLRINGQVLTIVSSCLEVYRKI